jgi:transcriptional regulator with GAF, ATPase, and Fis domain
MIRHSLALRRVRGLIERVAPSSISVLISGEIGTGKELVARAIHERSPRHERPNVAINCAAIPETLMETHCLVMSAAHSREPIENGQDISSKRTEAHYC